MYKHSIIATILLAVAAGNAVAAEVTRVYVDDLDLAELKIESPRSGGSIRSRDFELTADERADIATMYKDAVEDAIGGSKSYEIVEDADGAEVVIQADLLNIRPTAPKDDFRSRNAMETYYTEGAGRATIRFEISDNDELSKVFESSRDAGSFWRENDRFSNTQDVKRLFRSWGGYLVKKLDKIDS